MTADALSIESYRSLGSVKKQQAQLILDAIKLARHPSSSDLERFTHIQRSSVTGRLRELEQEGLIFKAGTKKDPFTKKTVNWYAPVVTIRRDDE